jgi:protein required for attachment to host cells
MNTCVLVADASRGRLFRADRSGRLWELLESFEHADSRARVIDLTTDAPGRKPGGHPISVAAVPRTRSAQAGRPGAEPDTDPKEVEAKKFARELANRLEVRLNERAYDDLIVAAAPHFLGLFRATVSPIVLRHVTAWLHKNLTKLKPTEVRLRIRREIARQAGASG